MKVLILSCTIGGGHNSAGRSLLEQFNADGIECEMLDSLSFVPGRPSKMISGIHSVIYRKQPVLFGRGYNMAEWMHYHNGRRPIHKSTLYKTNTLYTKRIWKYISANGFDAVIATHFFPAMSLTDIRHRFCPCLPSFFVATDYTCCPFQEEADIDAYFIPHASLMDEFSAKGLPREKLIPTGIPVSPKYHDTPDMASAREMLSIPHDSPTALIMTGSMGAGRAPELIGALLDRLPENSTVINICGNNSALKEDLNRRFSASGRFVNVGYTDNVPLYMAASNIILTKGGGLTSTEAAAKPIPIIHLPAVPGCETRNIQFFTSHGLSVTADSCSSLAEEAAKLISDEHSRAEMMLRQRNTINAYAARDICRYVADFE